MTDLGIREFDLAEVLTSTDSIAAFVQAVAEDTDHDAGAIIRAFRVAVRARGASTVAADVGLSVEALEEALGDGGNPSFETILNIARAVGLKVSFEPEN
jgi:probable addiction module antidote protein